MKINFLAPKNKGVYLEISKEDFEKEFHGITTGYATVPAPVITPEPFVLPTFLEPWEEEVYRALFELPSTAGEIANYLQRHGFVGYRERADECPLSRYIRAKTHHHIGVGYDGLYLIEDGRAMSSRKIETPLHCRNFMDHFDQGDYPFLCDPRPAPPKIAPHGFASYWKK